MNLVLDTNAYSNFRRGNPELTRLLENADAILVPATVVGELCAGFLQGNRWAQNWTELEDFLCQPGIQLVDTGLAEAMKYGLLVKNLRAAGTPIPTNDLWIAACALAQGAALLTRDAHFDQIQGLFVVKYQ